ncbi:MAG TPA: glycosyltransferase 87 family protein [Rubrobacteraceae bacterium]|nr:glycosyltransferase 87 family protein [Rubrobacteraceae bacterium]
MKRSAILLLILLLLPLLSVTLGLRGGTHLDEQQARQRAELAPKVANLVEHPSVQPSATYDSVSDTWLVLLTEEVSGSVVAKVTVDDDTGDVVRTEISPNATGISYPSLSEEDATKLATADIRVRDYLSDFGSYSTDTEYENGEWTIHYRIQGTGAVGGVPDPEAGTKEIVRAGVDDDTWVVEYVWAGDQVGWQMARGEYGSYGKQANYWYVWGPMALLFALAFVRADKMFSLRNLDILMLLGFLVSHGFWRAGDSYEAVLLWYPPLIYLLVRTLLMGFGIGERVEKTANFPTPVLFILAALAGGFVLALNLDARVIDVGYAGVVGADRILDGTLPYGHMPSDVGTGDTYGPLNYLLYVPFVLMFGFSGKWDYLPAAHATTAFAFTVGALALLYAGYRLAGARGAAAMVFAWAVFPYTLYSTNNNTNDVIVAAASAVSLAFATSPLGRGASIAAGFAIKLYPLILAPLWMAQDRWKRSSIVDFALGGVGVCLLTFWILTLDGDIISALKLFYQKTITFQGDRETPWTIFAQVPQIAFLKRLLTAAVIFLAVLVAIFPRKRTVRRLAALSAALVIAVQLVTNYWFYTYVVWFEPFVFLALFTATNEKTALDGETEPPPEASVPQNAGTGG